MYEQEKWELRDRSARDLGLGSADDVRLEVMVPFYAKTGRVSRRRRERLRARLVELLAPPREEVPAPSTEACDDPGPAPVAAACAACRGRCCSKGEEHAYLKAEDLRRAGGPIDPREIVELYLGFVPERAYKGSCIFHSATGCALPRALRSRTCTRYLCGALTNLQTSASVRGQKAALLLFPQPRRTRRVVIRLGNAVDASTAAEQGAAEPQG